MDQQLVTIEPKTALAVFTEDKAIDIYLNKIRAEIDQFAGDVSTDKGRKEIASMAYKVARSKTYLDGVGKELADEVKLIPKKIDATRKHVRDKLEGWQDEVRKPLTDWENAEKARVDRHNEAITRINTLAVPTNEIGAQLDAATLRSRLAEIEAVKIGPECEEFEALYARAKDEGVTLLKRALEAREKFDAEQAELERLRKADAERIERERIETIQREAADKAKREAEEKAERDRIQAEQAAETYRKAQEMDRLAEQKAAQEREAKLVAEKIEAEKRASEAEAKAKRDAEADRQRIEAESRRREEDREHRAKINNAAVDAFVAGGIDAEVAKKVVILIASKSIPAVSINY